MATGALHLPAVSMLTPQSLPEETGKLATRVISHTLNEQKIQAIIDKNNQSKRYITITTRNAKDGQGQQNSEPVSRTLPGLSDLRVTEKMPTHKHFLTRLRQYKISKQGRRLKTLNLTRTTSYPEIGLHLRRTSYLVVKKQGDLKTAKTIKDEGPYSKLNRLSKSQVDIQNVDYKGPSTATVYSSTDHQLTTDRKIFSRSTVRTDHSSNLSMSIKSGISSRTLESDSRMRSGISRYMASNKVLASLRPQNTFKRKPVSKKSSEANEDNSDDNEQSYSAATKGTHKLPQLQPLIKPPMSPVITNNRQCMFRVFGPILLSAPHGIKLWRGGSDGRRRRIHYREVWSTEIVLKLAIHINRYTGVPASFIVWDRRVALPADSRNLDPNYLTEKQFSQSPFHEALVYFKKFGNVNRLPIMHIDIHGKKNRKHNMDMDFGFKALHERYSDQGLVSWLKSEAESKFTELFESLPGNKKYTCNMDPSLCGDWGGDLYTMTSQSVCLGIPAFQLEIPKFMREHLVADNDFLSKFAKCIVDIYTTCVATGSDEKDSTVYRENEMSTDYIEKLINQHVRLERNSSEKQI